MTIDELKAQGKTFSKTPPASGTLTVQQLQSQGKKLSKTPPQKKVLPEQDPNNPVFEAGDNSQRAGSTSLATVLPKSLANTAKSVGKFATGIFHFLDPFESVPKAINSTAQIPEAVSGLAKDKAAADTANSNEAQAAQTMSDRIAALKGQGKDTTRLETMFNRLYPHGVPKKGGVQKATDSSLGRFLGALPEAATKELAPAAVNQGLDELDKGKSLGDAAYKTVQSIAEDPAQLAPLIIGGDAMLKDTKVGGVVDDTVSKVTDRVTAPVRSVFKKATQPFLASHITENQVAFDEAGIKAPVSAVTKSPLLKGAEALSSKGLFGGAVRETFTRAIEQVNQKTNEVVEKLKPQNIISQENIGKTIQEGIKNFDDNFKATATKIYDNFSELTGNPKAVIKNSLEVARDIVRGQSMDLLKGVNRNILGLVQKLNRASSDATGKVSYYFDNLKNTRTAVGEELSRNPENAAMKRLYGALSEDMDATVRSVNKNFGKMLDKVNAEYKAGIQKIQSNVAQSIEQSNPERIAANIIKRNSSEFLKQLKGMVGQERFTEISKAFLNKTLTDAVSRGKFDVTKFQKLLNDYDPATLTELLGADKYKTVQDAVVELNKYKNVEDILKSQSKISEGSQTAYLENIARKSSEAGGLVVAVLTGHFTIAAALLADFGVEYLGSKLFSTELGKQLLTSGIDLSDSAAMKLLNKINQLPTRILPPRT